MCFEERFARLVRVDHATADEVRRRPRHGEQSRCDQTARRQLRTATVSLRAFSKAPTASAMETSVGIESPLAPKPDLSAIFDQAIAGGTALGASRTLAAGAIACLTRYPKAPTLDDARMAARVRGGGSTCSPRSFCGGDGGVPGKDAGQHKGQCEREVTQRVRSFARDVPQTAARRPPIERLDAPSRDAARDVIADVEHQRLRGLLHALNRRAGVVVKPAAAASRQKIRRRRWSRSRRCGCRADRAAAAGRAPWRAAAARAASS